MWTRPRAAVDIVNRTIQGRHLIKPSPQLNRVIVGALAKARQKHKVDVYCGAFLGSHFHLYLRANTVYDQACFMRDFTRKLSLESGILYDWRSSTFPNRYHAAEVSEEPETQIRRLTYQLKNSCKEGLVSSPLDWPGVNFAEALISGEPLRGIWIDRSGYYRAKQRGKDVTLEDFTEHLELPLEPLPCWRDVEPATRRRYVLEIVRQIEVETAAQHRELGSRPMGAEAVLAGDPHFRPDALESSPQPLFHAARQEIRDTMREALALIYAAYLEAARRLREGDRTVEFPENTFPPGLPFVVPSSRVIWEPG